MKQAIDQTLELQRSTLGADSRWLLLALVVIAAPLFEEFIFRGLLFSGFRRSIGALPAALASATVFALVHPVIAALPVFVLAVGAALVLERTRWLGAPIAAHMTYNAIVAGIPMISS
jgi:membrane protease YdiL (CAAX protease family)